MAGAGKWIAGGLAVMVLAVGGELLWIHHRNVEDETATVAKPEYKSDPDDLVFLKQEHPMLLKDAKDLKGRTLWVSAGGQMDYYPVSGGHVDFAHSQGVLLSAEQIVAKDAVEQVAPAKTAIRIPAGDKQVLLVFTKAADTKEFATPIGYKQGGDYTFETDQIFFYDDPHQLYSYWGPAVWKAIDAHQAIPGMSERQVQMALGQVSKPDGDKVGDRIVTFDDQGHPKRVTFVNNKATAIQDASQ